MAQVAMLVGALDSHMKADLLDRLAVDGRLLYRVFKRHVGQTVTDYVGQLRIGHARQLLITSDMPIARVAEAAGYENLSLFNRQFRCGRGETPRRFRRTFQRGTSLENAR